MRIKALTLLSISTALALTWCASPYGSSTDAPPPAAPDAGNAADASNEDGPNAIVEASVGLDGSSDADATTSTCESKCCTDGVACSSCAEIHTNKPDFSSGPYEIVGASSVLSVYCDMVTAGGGWTLVARSTANVNTELGWKISTGQAGNDNAPYSLSVATLGFSPTQILFGSRTSGKTWGETVYQAKLPIDFITHGDDGVKVQITAVAGTCPLGGTMQQYFGHTNLSEVYFMRDLAEPSIYGLRSDGFNTNASTKDCTQNGNLAGEQGMIFVR